MRRNQISSFGQTSLFKLAGASVQSTTGSRGVRISGSNAGYTMFRGSVKSTGYHNPFASFPFTSLPCVTVCHHISTGLYRMWIADLQGPLLYSMKVADLFQGLREFTYTFVYLCLILYVMYFIVMFMYSYWQVCSVLYTLCQLAFSGYPDWGFFLLFPQL
jgi:hypothetical protein